MNQEGKPVQHIRSALYARVSSDQQAQEGTIDSQVSLLRQRIEADGAVVDEALFFLDDGVSGSTLVRPGLERLRDQAAAGAIERLYVLAPDRLARRHVHQMVLVEELQACGVDIVFVNRPLGATPEDQLLLQVQGVIAEYERAKILERTRRGRLHAARCGRISVLGGAPYGYRYVDKHTGGGVAAYEVIEEEAEIVRQIFGWVALEGCSLAEVARRLEERGVRPRQRLRQRRRWDRGTIWGMLTNPAYRGQAAYGKTRRGERRSRLRPRRGQPDVPKHPFSTYTQPASAHLAIAVPALVDAELFAAVQERLEENRRRLRASRHGARYLLQGLTVCGYCGYAVCARPSGGTKNGGPYSYYYCPGSEPYRFGGRRVCSNARQRVEDLEAEVWKDVCALLNEPDRLREEFERRQQNPAVESAGADSERLKKAITKSKQSISRLIDVFTEGLLEGREFESRIQRLKERLAQLQSELAKVQERSQQDHELRLATVASTSLPTK
jgi:site-specific DNA recombinase